MRVLVLYESRRGFTLTVSRAIRDAMREAGVEATAAPIGTVDAGTVAAADALVVGTWTAGKIVVGVGPAPAALSGVDALPDLDGRPTAVFCTYDVSPRETLSMLASRLIRRGAAITVGGTFRNGPLPKTRRRSLETVPAFVDDVLTSFRERTDAAAEGR